MDFDPAEYAAGFDPAAYARGGAPAVDMGPEARRARAGMAPDANPQAEEARTGAGGPVFTPNANYTAKREKTPYEKSSIDPTAQVLAENMVLGGASGYLGGMLGRALANTRGGQLAQIVEEGAAAKPEVVPGQHSDELVRAWGGTPKPAEPIPDLAAERAAEELKFRFIPPHLTPHMSSTAAAIDLARANASALSGATSRAMARHLAPKMLVSGDVAARELTNAR